MRSGKYITDYHLHSNISPDGNHTMAEMAKAAVEMGVDELCFTDHVEPLHWLKWNDPPRKKGSYDWEAMLRQFQDAREALGHRIRLRMGAELGECVAAFDVADSFLDTAPQLDFTIGSVHVYRLENGVFDDFCWVESDDPARWDWIAGRYLDELEKMVSWGRFSVLGHLTLPERYAWERHGVALRFDRYEERLRAILKAAIDRGLGIELNSNRGNAPLPGEKWLKIYRELGGEIVTLGSDAHRPQHIACAMEERQELLKACGFDAFCTFDAGQPVFHRL